jgi:polar amino acid transport system substrate-binding protein
MQVVGELGPATPIAWAVNKSNAPLADALSAEIKKLKTSSKLQDLQMKYFKYTTELPESGFIPAK